MSCVVRCRCSGLYEAEAAALAAAAAPAALQPPERSEGGSDAARLAALVENLLKEPRPENSGDLG